MGYVNKLYRGLSAEEFHPGEPEHTVEKLWVAAAEIYAIGGACQLLHVMDHVIAERGCRLYLPARKEGIIPGASNLRLPRSVGDRLARQAILSGSSSRRACRRRSCCATRLWRPARWTRGGGARRGFDELGPDQRGGQPARSARG